VEQDNRGSVSLDVESPEGDSFGLICGKMESQRKFFSFDRKMAL
jgi:hypothetical protein